MVSAEKKLYSQLKSFYSTHAKENLQMLELPVWVMIYKQPSCEISVSLAAAFSCSL